MCVYILVYISSYTYITEINKNNDVTENERRHGRIPIFVKLYKRLKYTTLNVPDIARSRATIGANFIVLWKSVLGFQKKEAFGLQMKINRLLLSERRELNKINPISTVLV